MNIPFADLQSQYLEYKSQIDQRMQKVLDSASFINGPEVSELESSMCEFVDSKYSIACANGTDALTLALMALDIGSGDEVIVPAFSYFASAESVSLVGAKPIFVDVRPDTCNLEAETVRPYISEKTKAIIPVSLYGQTARMAEFQTISNETGIAIIEDGAQSLGAGYHNKYSGNLSLIGCTSFFPAKPLGCYGDGGMLFTSDEQIAEKLRSLRSHGQGKRYEHLRIGTNSRLDTLQAAVLLAKLPFYKEEIAHRQNIATRYTQAFSGIKELELPIVLENHSSVWAQYTLKTNKRDQLQSHLKQAGIPTAIHYPRPIHKQTAYASQYTSVECPVSEILSESVLSIPMSAFLKNEHQDYIIEKIREFFAA
tara:strand:- start:1340 stop:2443 length:1104 start_codon:yes stop_codon:yes gene_type:complete